MALLNYTSKVPAEQTIGEIQRMLVRHGARAIQIEYDDDGEASSVAFQIKTPVGPESYRLPASIDAALAVLLRQQKQRAGHIATPTRAQASKTAWRIVKDWIEAQLALIETEMVTLPEIMLPWMLTPSGATVYELFERRQLALPGPNPDVNDR